MLRFSDFVQNIFNISNKLQWDSCYCCYGDHLVLLNHFRSPFAYLLFLPEFLANNFNAKSLAGSSKWHTSEGLQPKCRFPPSHADKHNETRGISFPFTEKSQLCVIEAWEDTVTLSINKSFSFQLLCSLTLWSGHYIISRPHQTVDGVRLYLVPTGSVGFLKLVIEQWPWLQRNTNGAVCNLSFSAAIPVDRRLLMKTVLCSTHTWPPGYKGNSPVWLSLQILPSHQSNNPTLP